MQNTKLNFAAIDIGSNAVRLLIKSVSEGESTEDMTKNILLRIPLRLGEDAFGTGTISEGKEKQLIRTIKSFKLLLKIFGVTAYRACATSAMRDASNGMRIAEKIQKKTGIRIEIIEGEEEARIVYDSHIGDLLDSEGNYIYVDVGGGSTEISLICDGGLQSSRSYNIGTVRMLAGKVKQTEWDRLNHDLAELARRYPDLEIIGSGGNINKLNRLGGQGKNSNTLPVEALREIYDTLRKLPMEQRMEKFKLNPDRADVIVPAAEIFLNIARLVSASFIFVPTIGIIDGITHALYAEYIREKRP